MMLHDVLLSLSDAEALSALLDAHRRARSSESDTAGTLADVLAHARRVPDENLPGCMSKNPPALSPIGRALIGRRRGELVDAELPGGRIVTIQVLAVQPDRPKLREAA